MAVARVLLIRMSTFTVREARIDDAWEIARVHVRAWQEAYRGIVPDERLEALSVNRRAANWSERFKHGLAGRFTYVADGDGGLAGWRAGGLLHREGGGRRRGTRGLCMSIPAFSGAA